MTPDQLLAWRIRAGLSQVELAKLLGVHVITLSRWERWDRGIPPYLHLALEQLRYELTTRRAECQANAMTDRNAHAPADR